jgi:hypothetical protein
VAWTGCRLAVLSFRIYLKYTKYGNYQSKHEAGPVLSCLNESAATSRLQGPVHVEKIARTLSPLTAPGLYGPCNGPTKHSSGVRAEDCAINLAGVALENGQELAVVGPPEPRGIVRWGHIVHVSPSEIAHVRSSPAASKTARLS